MPNKITAANAGLRTPFLYRGSRHGSGVAEFGRWDRMHLRNHTTLKKLLLAIFLCWSLGSSAHAFGFLGPNPALHDWTVSGPGGEYGVLVWPSESKVVVGSQYYTVKGGPVTLGVGAAAVLVGIAVSLLTLGRPLCSAKNPGLTSSPTRKGVLLRSAAGWRVLFGFLRPRPRAAHAGR